MQKYFFNKITGACNFIKKDTLVQLFSCEFKNLSFFLSEFKFLRTPFLWNTSGGRKFAGPDIA